MSLPLLRNRVGTFIFFVISIFFCYFLDSRYFLGDTPTILENRREK